MTLTPFVRIARRPWLLALPGAAAVLVAALSLAPPITSGQTAPAASATPAAPVAGGVASSAPALDNEAAVRTLLPASIRDSVKLPVRKWARVDMPDAPGGYIVFIATIYPIYDGQGGSTEWLLTNYLQWNGFQWLPGVADYAGYQLKDPDDIWLARNLTDITAVASPPGQDWRVFTVAYTGDGIVNSTLARTETLMEIYDLTDSTAWSRVITLSETDTSNPGYVLRHAEDVDWSFQVLDDSGLYSLVATVTDTDEVILTGSPAPAGAVLPAAGVSATKTTEVYKWIDGVYVLQRQAPAPAPAASGPALPIVTATPSAPATAPAAAGTAAPPRVVATAPPAPVASAPSTTPAVGPAPISSATPRSGPAG